MNLKNNNIKYIYIAPDYETWEFLRSIVGWKPYSIQIYNQVVQNSLCFVSAVYDNKIVGMGRLVGDNITSFYIQGIVVNPLYQGQGIGTNIVNKLLCYVQEKAIEGATVHLFAHKGTESFYEKCGFQQQPNLYKGAGMSKKIDIPTVC